MWILILIGGTVCAFGLLNALSSERQRRIERFLYDMRLAEEEKNREQDEIPVVGSPAGAQEPNPIH